MQSSVIAIFGVILLAAAFIIIRWAKSSKKPIPPPPPICDCKSWEQCIDGKCIPLTVCGQPSIPSGERCSADFLICDESTNKWHCDGPAHCDDGWDGIHCTCNKGDRQITNYCEGEIPICQENGTYTYQQASTCNELNLFLEGAGITLDSECHDQCNGNSCGNNGTCICNDSGGEADISCLKQCNPAPDPVRGECGMTIGNPVVACPEFQTCICDVSTGYDWKCEVVEDPSKPNQCPPDPPQKYCKDSSGKDMDLVCMPCVYQGQEGSIKFCPGSNQVPLDCLKSRYGLVQETAPTVGSEIGTSSWYESQIENNLPVYPTVDNSLCESGNISNTRLQSDLGIFYSIVGNPTGNILETQTGRQFLPFNSDLYYYQSSNDPTVPCYWSDHPDCSNRGIFHQFCNPGHPCSSSDPLSSRLKQGQCECDEYISQFTGNAAKYVGCNCQFSDFNCSNNGSAYTETDCSTVLCACGKDTNGPICQFTRAETCGGHGSPNYDGTCSNCDSGYVGNKCQYSRATCSNKGNPDPSGKCNCDDGWAGSNCFFNTNNPDTAWVDNCDCGGPGQGFTCANHHLSQDPNARAQCAANPTCACSLASSQNEAQNKCICCGC